MDIHVSEAVAKLARLDLYALAGLVGTPGVWGLEVVLSRAMSAERCSDHTAMFTADNAGSANTGSFCVSSIAILSSLLFAMLATRGFLQSNTNLTSVKTEQGSDGEETLPPRKGRRYTRKRLIALCSAIVGGSCAIGLLFTVLAEVFRGACGLWQ